MYQNSALTGPFSLSHVFKFPVTAPCREINQLKNTDTRTNGAYMRVILCRTPRCAFRKLVFFGFPVPQPHCKQVCEHASQNNALLTLLAVLLPQVTSSIGHSRTIAWRWNTKQSFFRINVPSFCNLLRGDSFMYFDSPVISFWYSANIVCDTAYRLRLQFFWNNPARSNVLFLIGLRPDFFESTQIQEPLSLAPCLDLLTHQGVLWQALLRAATSVVLTLLPYQSTFSVFNLKYCNMEPLLLPALRMLSILHCQSSAPHFICFIPLSSCRTTFLHIQPAQMQCKFC